MRKLSILIVVIFLSVTFSGCSNYKTAISFKEEKVENSYNNYLAGGNLAYCDNALYYFNNAFDRALRTKAYKFTDKGRTNMLGDKKIPALYFKGFYELDNKIYSFLEDDTFLSVYDSGNRKFVKSDFDIKTKYDYYLSEKLIISYKNSKTLKVYYKEKTYAVILESGIDRFYPVDEIIYLQNNNGALYSYNLKTPDKAPEFIDELADGGSYKVFSVCGGYVYYDYDKEDGDITNGLYRFSLKDESHKLVTDKEVSCVNSLNGKFYFVADGNLYLDNPQRESDRITDLKTKNIYIFDNKWIYLDDNNDNVFRVNTQSGVIERIDVLTMGQLK